MKIRQGRYENRHLLVIHYNFSQWSLPILLCKFTLDFMVESVDLLRVIPHVLCKEDEVRSLNKASLKISIDIRCFETGRLPCSF